MNIETKKEFVELVEQYKAQGVHPYVVKARDKFLSGWGRAEGDTHYQVVVCVNYSQTRDVEIAMERDGSLKNITTMSANSLLKSSMWRHSYTIRGEWGLANVHNF